MARIFVSHASTEDAEINQLSTLLTEAGFKDHFIDHRHIAAGASWDRELQEELRKSEVLLALVSRDWLASTECYSEFRSFQFKGKAIVPILAVDTPDELSQQERKRFDFLCTTVQGIPLAKFPPDVVTSQTLCGALVLAEKDVKRRRARRILSRVGIASSLILASLVAFSLYFWQFLTAYIEEYKISNAFRAESLSKLAEMAKTAETASSGDAGVAKQTFLECTDNSYCPEMVVIPGGTLLLGTRDDNPLTNTELPNVEIDVPTFAVSTAEITRSQWLKCFIATRFQDGGKCKQVLPSAGSDEYPVDSVSWRDAQIYIDWLNTATVGTPEGPYRLLSEVEWEYAARGVAHFEKEPERMYFFWGSESDEACKFANMRNAEMPPEFQTNWKGIKCVDNTVGIAPAKKYLANDFGLYDTAGNLAEWVADCWHDSHRGRPENAGPWVRSADKECQRVIKGGSWYGNPDNLRIAARTKLHAHLFGFNIGFRVARDLDWAPEDTPR